MKLSVACSVPHRCLPIRDSATLKVASQLSPRKETLPMFRSDVIVSCCLMVGAALSAVLYLSLVF